MQKHEKGYLKFFSNVSGILGDGTREQPTCHVWDPTGTLIGTTLLTRELFNENGTPMGVYFKQVTPELHGEYTYIFNNNQLHPNEDVQKGTFDVDDQAVKTY